jgi:hypothetical protein
MNDFTYEKVTNEFGNEIIKRTDKNDYVLWIPLDSTNSDYIAYLASLDKSTVIAEIIEPVEESEPTEPADEASSDTE